MAENLHEAAPHHLPGFITAPGETDVLFVVVVVALIAIVLLVGNFYFKLHALPERMAHSANSAQFQLVGVLALLALFTHNNIFWVAALLIAALKIPDFTTPLYAISETLTGLSARLERREAEEAGEVTEIPQPAPPPAPEPPAGPTPPVAEAEAPDVPDAPRERDG